MTHRPHTVCDRGTPAIAYQHLCSPVRSADPTISKTCFSHLNCRQLAGDLNVLDQNYGITCGSFLGGLLPVRVQEFLQEWSSKGSLLGISQQWDWTQPLDPLKWISLIAILIIIIYPGYSAWRMHKAMAKELSKVRKREKRLVHVYDDFSWDWGYVPAISPKHIVSACQALTTHCCSHFVGEYRDGAM